MGWKPPLRPRYGLFMKTAILIAAVALALSASGCASSQREENRMNRTPWHEHLSPAPEDTMSDWSLFDLDADTYSQSNLSNRGENIRDDLTLFW